MAPVKRRRRLPTLIDRGLGLLEVILPVGVSGRSEPPLPAGRRDCSGFWYPTGYEQPSDLFTPQQRVLQAKQRLVQRVRQRPRKRPPALPQERPTAQIEVSAVGLSEVSLPLPSPLLDAPKAGETRRPVGSSRRGSIGITAEPRLVDSREGSD